MSVGFAPFNSLSRLWTRGSSHPHAYPGEKPDSPDSKTQRDSHPNSWAPTAEGRREQHTSETGCWPGMRAWPVTIGTVGSSSTQSLLETHRPLATFAVPGPSFLQRGILMPRQDLPWGQHVPSLPVSHQSVLPPPSPCPSPSQMWELQGPLPGKTTGCPGFPREAGVRGPGHPRPQGAASASNPSRYGAPGNPQEMTQDAAA